MANNADKPATVTLRDGAEVSPGRVISILGTLKALNAMGERGQLLLRCLRRMCGKEREDLANIASPKIIQTLVKIDLVGSDGTPPEDVRHVVRSALVRKFKGSPTLTLRDPHIESEKNDTAFDSLLEKVSEALDLKHFSSEQSPTKPSDDSGRSL